MMELNKGPAFYYQNYLQIMKKSNDIDDTSDELEQKLKFTRLNAQKEADDSKRENAKKIGAEVRNVGASDITLSSQADALDDMALQAHKEENFIRQEEDNQIRTLNRKARAASRTRQHDYGLGLSDLFNHFKQA